VKFSLLGCVLLLLPVQASTQRRAVPRGSFLASPAHTTKALLKQFDSNAEVRRRYLKIFGRGREESRRILSRLTPKELSSTHTYPVAYYSESGEWTYRDKVLPKGTRVFVTPEGKPFLKEECGNPLVVSLPYPSGRGMATRPPVRLPRSLMPPDITVVVTPHTPPEGPLAPPEGEFWPPIASVPPAGLGHLVTPEGESLFFPEGSPELLAQPGVPHGADSPFWLGLLLPLLLLLDDDDLGGGPPPPGPLVPETSSWVMMAAGGVGILAMGRRGRSRRSK
jgi:hypothetical protein